MKRTNPEDRVIILCNLTRPTLPFDETTYIFGGEGGYFNAYQDNLNAAKAIVSQPHEFYWFGVHLLHFSVECFLKYAYCLARKKIFGIQSVTQKAALKRTWDLDKFPFKGKHLPAEQFSHNLNNLRLFFEHYPDAWRH